MFQSTDSFTQKELIIMGVSLLAGGAFGAVLKILWDAYQGRVQPVSYQVAFVQVFREKLSSSSLRAALVLTDGVETRNFPNLYMAEIVIRNSGNAHIEEFAFG